MTSGLTSVIFAIGFAGWMYSKMINRTGGNNETAIKATAGASLAVLLLLYSLLRFILKF